MGNKRTGKAWFLLYFKLGDENKQENDAEVLGCGKYVEF